MKPGSHLRAGETSLANVWELIRNLLDAAAVGSVVEVGAFRGELTRDLLDWAASRTATVIAIDPRPAEPLERLAAQQPALDLIRETSFDALDHIAIPDAVIIDGDHNYYTVTGELARIHAKRPGAAFPLAMFHDVGWPLARQDSYHDPDNIPAEHRHPIPPGQELAPAPSFADPRPFAHTTTVEGGPRNGGLTAIEDFAATHAGLRYAVIAAFFGFGVLWHDEAPYATAVERIVAPFDRHPIIERLEADRVQHLIAEQVHARRVVELEAVLRQSRVGGPRWLGWLRGPRA